METEEVKYAWRPNSQAQYDFCAAGEFEALYGGAKGAGKSMVLVAMAMRYITKPLYRAIVFRRTYPRLRELTDIARRLYPIHGGKGSDSSTEWTFPSGARILFSHLQHETDVDNHQGQQYQFIAFDEVTQFLESQYLALLSCCRSPDPEIPCFLRSTTNPGGIGHAWVKARFVDTCLPVIAGPPVRLDRWNITAQPVAAGAMYVDPVTHLTRRFYPGRVWDNADLLQASPHYVAGLQSLSKGQSAAYLYGDWTSFEGQYFPEWSEARHVRPPWEVREGTDQWGIPTEWVRFGGIDYGSANPWAAVECAVDPANGRVIVYRAIAAPGWTHEMQADWLKSGSPKADYVADDVCFNRGNPNDTKVRQISDAELWTKYGFHRVRPAQKGRRVPGWSHVREFLKPYGDTDRAWIEVLDVPGARGKYGLITTLPKMTYDDGNPEDMLSDTPDDARDDACDCLRYALLTRPAPKYVPPPSKDPFKPGDYFHDWERRKKQLQPHHEIKGSINGW